MAVVKPMTSPYSLKSGPPLEPWEIAAVVCMIGPRKAHRAREGDPGRVGATGLRSARDRDAADSDSRSSTQVGAGFISAKAQPGDLIFKVLGHDERSKTNRSSLYPRCSKNEDLVFKNMYLWG